VKGIFVRNARRREELSRLQAEIEEAQPFLELAREIRREVALVAADTPLQADTLAELIDRIPHQERLAVARAIFAKLPADQQWAIIERVYGDEEITSYLGAEREALLASVRRNAGRAAIAHQARADQRLDTRAVPDDDVLTIGLFREPDVRAAIHRGRAASTCARRVVLRHVGGPGTFAAVEDVFNPTGGFFVTAQYDERTWRSHDRLPPHAVVRVGTITTGKDGSSFEPVMYLGGRVDFETVDGLKQGRLHAGFAMMGDYDVFGE
jgi:hypothetical protein